MQMEINSVCVSVAHITFFGSRHLSPKVGLFIQHLPKIQILQFYRNIYSKKTHVKKSKSETLQ